MEYGSKLQEAGVDVRWDYFPDLTYGFLQMALWARECMSATIDMAKELKRMAYAS